MNIDILQSSESNEWYTPAVYMKAVQQVLRGIELDPASCEQANQIVQAQHYYTLEQNGLMHSWQARSVWLNPPYGKSSTGESNQEIWTCRLIGEYEAGHIEEAILLVNAVTGNAWFQRLWNYHICFTNHRIRFYSPSTLAVQPTFSNAFVYFGKDGERFKTLFRQFGRIVDPDRSIASVVNLELWQGNTA